MSLLYKREKKFSIFTDFHYGGLPAVGPKIHLEKLILTRLIEINVQERCQGTPLGMLEVCAVTGCDFLYKREKNFSIFTVFHYSRFST